MTKIATTILLSIAAVFLIACGDSQAVESGSRPTFRADPSLIPAFSQDQTDYAIRCRNKPVSLALHVPDGWQGKADRTSFTSGNRSVQMTLRAGQQKTVDFRRADGSDARRFHIRCLPLDFGPFQIRTRGEGGPRLTMVQLSNGYAGAFDSGGAPVWWYQADSGTSRQADMNTENAQFMPDGTFSYAPINGYFGRQFQVRTLEGKLVRELVAADGLSTDLHDLVLLPNGNYLLGAHRIVDNIDTRRFGGPKNASIDTAQIQELRPNGKLVWKWDAWPRVKLAESARWWKHMLGWGQPYDVNHWNSVERRGKFMLMSFRHLDAILKINRRTGRIIWKLGGTKTAKRLKVTGDPRGRYPFGGQHDARFAPGGTVTLFDNQTDLDRVKNPRPPRAVRYKIDQRRNRARLVDQIRDKRAEKSLGFASARIVEDGNWIVDWGASGSDQIIGGYRPGGKRVFSLVTPGNLSYRAVPASGPKPTIRRLRKAMDRMYKRR